MLKQPHQSIKTQCVRLSQLLQFQTTNYDSSWQNIFNQINRTERGFLLSVLSKLFGSIIYGTDESELILQPHFYFRY
ncbi:hypothetical protein EWM55_10265 [Enterococcus faecium]|nr:hypothetical protein EXV96_09045 [Enterococcus faecium]QCR67306.1 hypothetical protein FBF65_09975 [Enterococcus faecium]QCS46708.1 hypothetical protein FEF08_08940 [Enterococcus faecium]QCV44000.1 hypothetical protein EWH22_10265 [Enterococcus faecium]QCV47091.1 hypothetical protein EWM55_10265 [Enterococcus faecium]